MKDAKKTSFEVLGYRVEIGDGVCRVGSAPEASIKVKIGDKIVHKVADGNGPVNALDRAMRKALSPVYPCLKRIHLVDYWVRITNGKSGTAAEVEVLIEFSDGKSNWITKASSTDIIRASFRALEAGLREKI